MQQGKMTGVRRILRLLWEVLFPYEIRWGTEEVATIPQHDRIEFSRLSHFDKPLIQGQMPTEFEQTSDLVGAVPDLPEMQDRHHQECHTALPKRELPSR